MYPGAPEPGWMLYIKPTYQANEGVGSRSYASQHATLPHESTADQWFGESQLESYRALGAYLMGLLCSGAKAPTADRYLHAPVREPERKEVRAG